VKRSDKTVSVNPRSSDRPQNAGFHGSSGTKVPDAGVDAALDVAVVDAAPDVAATEMGSSSDGAPTDIASDSGAGDTAGTADGGGADGTDGGADPCHPPCRERLFGGGVVCATLDATRVWRGPNGAPLGTVSINADGSNTPNIPVPPRRSTSTPR
jgi:hypothetical protein